MWKGGKKLWLTNEMPCTSIVCALPSPTGVLFQSKPEAGLKRQILLCVWYENKTSPPAVGANSPTLTSKQLPNQCFKDLELDPITAEYSVNLNLGKLIN